LNTSTFPELKPTEKSAKTKLDSSLAHTKSDQHIDAAGEIVVKKPAKTEYVHTYNSELRVNTNRKRNRITLTNILLSILILLTVAWNTGIIPRFDILPAKAPVHYKLDANGNEIVVGNNTASKIKEITALELSNPDKLVSWVVNVEHGFTGQVSLIGRIFSLADYTSLSNIHFRADFYNNKNQKIGSKNIAYNVTITPNGSFILNEKFSDLTLVYAKTAKLTLTKVSANK